MAQANEEDAPQEDTWLLQGMPSKIHGDVVDSDREDNYDDDGTVQWYPVPSRRYTRRELVADGIVLSTGVLLSWIGLILLMTRTSNAGDMATKRTGLAVFCVGFLAMLNFSAAYNLFIWKTEMAPALIFLDATGIFLMIACSYTPICLQAECYRILCAEWTMAAVGIFLQFISQSCGDKPTVQVGSTSSTLLYVAMGWSIMFVWNHVQRCISHWAQVQILFSGCLVSVGIVFQKISRLEFHMAIWHLMVLGTTICLYWVCYKEIAAGFPLGEQRERISSHLTLQRFLH